MSTMVGTLIEEIQDRIPEEKMNLLFPLLNRAIDIVSKRLYRMESDLIIGELAVPVFASASYAASTIAFVHNGPNAADTITDSAAQFVTELFAAGMPITTTCAGNAGPLKVTAVTAGSLSINPEDSVVSQVAGSSYSITSLATFGYLPDDFNGLVAKPNIDGLTRSLEPIPSRSAELRYTGAGSPLFYKVRQNRLYVLPQTDTNITIVGDYFQRPVMITRMDQYVPFHGTMDSSIGECLVRILTAGPASITPEVYADMESFLGDEIDLYVPKRQKKAPASLPGGIDWNW